jgi:small-conductance mechanosensitive channel
MGTLDRTVRILIAIILGILILTGKISGTLAWVLGIIAVVFFAYKHHWMVPALCASWYIYYKERR